ncbi:hypothetical protein [Rhizobium halophytocola]|nr:hypothetical protein [Rhizobium halophytocola]
MIEKHANMSGMLAPDDLQVLQKIFDIICEKRHIAKNSIEAKREARILLDIYMAGIRSESQLLGMLV